MWLIPVVGESCDRAAIIPNYPLGLALNLGRQCTPSRLLPHCCCHSTRRWEVPALSKKRMAVTRYRFSLIRSANFLVVASVTLCGGFRS